jgi:dihydroorotate dehydrogenase (NAD+) catalytic subunit
MLAGASLVQVGTATFRNPAAPLKIARDLEKLAARLGIQAPADLIGKLEF